MGCGGFTFRVKQQHKKTYEKKDFCRRPSLSTLPECENVLSESFQPPWINLRNGETKKSSGQHGVSFNQSSRITFTVDEAENGVIFPGERREPLVGKGGSARVSFLGGLGGGGGGGDGGGGWCRGD